MKILHIIHSVNPAGGGPIEGIKQLARVQKDLGNMVVVASLDKPDDPWVKEFSLPLYPMGPGSMKYGYSPKLVPWLKESASAYDAVIVNGLWQYSGFGCWRALRNGPTPYFVFPHGMLDPWFKRHYPLKHLKKWLYWPWAEYRVLRDAKAVLFTCEIERRLARETFWLYRCREEVVNYGTAAPTGDANHQREMFLSFFPVLRGKRLILFLGRLHEKKGCDLLMEAFVRVAVKDPSLQLVIAGPDSNGMQEKLSGISRQAGMEAQVTWTGMLTGDLKWGALNAAEVFILPSHQENFGIAVAEALACSCPVLISNQVNIWEEILTDGAGFVASDDLAGTEKLLKDWLRLKAEEREKMRVAAQRCFAARFEIRKAGAHLLQVFLRHGVKQK